MINFLNKILCLLLAVIIIIMFCGFNIRYTGYDPESVSADIISVKTEENYDDNFSSSITSTVCPYPVSELTDYIFDYVTMDTEINTDTRKNNIFHSIVELMINEYGIEEFNVISDANAADPSYIYNAVLAGKKCGDLVETTLQTAIKLSRTNSLCDFNLARNIDLDESYFNKAVKENTTYGGKTYAVSFNYMSTNPDGVVFNKYLLYLNTPDYDIYDMYKNSKWTAENFSKLLAANSKNLDSNTGTYEICGAVSDRNGIDIALNSLTGGKILKDAVTGKFLRNYTSEAGIKTLEWCKNLINNKYWNCLPSSDEAADFFTQGKAAMFIGDMKNAITILSNSTYEMGFIPFPRPDDKTNYITQLSNEAAVYVVPKTNEANILKSGEVLNELSRGNDEITNLAVADYENSNLDTTGYRFYWWGIFNTTPDYSIDIITNEDVELIYNSVIAPTKTPAVEMNTIVANSVISQITSIGSVDKNSGAAILSTHNLYDELTDSQKELITNHNLLLEADVAYKLIVRGGDINYDGRVTAADALLALQYSINKTPLNEIQKNMGNVDLYDGISAEDALLILQYTVKKIDFFPINDVIK